MAPRKKKPSKRKPKKKSTPSSSKKKSTKAKPKKKKQSSVSSKKSSKGDIWSIAVLDAKTGKETKKPKKGQEVFYGVKSPKGKIQKIETEFSQRYAASDAKALQASLRSASPDAFVVYQQLTRTPARLRDGSFDYKTHRGEIVYRETESGKKVPEKKYKYKLTGRKPRQKQRAVIMSVKGYVHATGVGFTKKKAKEGASGKGLILVPVRRGVQSALALRGETIKDTVRNVKPSIGTKEMVKKGIHKLGIYGTIEISRPKNPFKKGTPEYAERESWMVSIWGMGGSGVIAVPFSRVVDRLANFSDVLAVTLREALSKQGYRLTSLMKLGQIEEEVEEEDEKNRRAGRKFTPLAPKIMQKPLWNSKKSADSFIPLRPEYEDRPMHKSASAYNAGIIVNLNVEPLK